MSMNFDQSGSDDSNLMVEMNTTPLIDVMLVLLVMLIITIPIQLHAVVGTAIFGGRVKPAAPPASSHG